MSTTLIIILGVILGLGWLIVEGWVHKKNLTEEQEKKNTKISGAIFMLIYAIRPAICLIGIAVIFSIMGILIGIIRIRKGHNFTKMVLGEVKDVVMQVVKKELAE